MKRTIRSIPVEVLTAMLLFTTATALAQSSAVVFTEVTGTAGVGLPDLLTESVAWGDYDNDGDLDLYLTNDGANRLFRNDGDDRFTDVTTEAGVGNALFSVGAVFGDLDNDGDLDLYVVNFGTGPDALYRNDGPTGPGGVHSFTDVTAPSGVIEEESSRGIAMIDVDRDGLLDIYVNAIGADLLYVNQGNLVFVNRAAALGIVNPGQGVGVVATDIDADGWIDLFTGNRSADPNRLLLNESGVFIDVTAVAGITEIGLGMGVHSFDADNDLDFDLYWTTWPGPTMRSNALYVNDGGGNFTEQAAVSGTEDASGWGISDNTGDVDNDGWEDFFVTNGFSDTTSANVLFQNDRDGTFSNATSVIGGGLFDGRGVAFADYDRDGDVDLCVTADTPSANRLWRNDSNNGNAWIGFNLTGTCSNRSAVGSRVVVHANTGARVKEVSGGAGRGSFNSLPVEFGLGIATSVPRTIVHWPSGLVQVLPDLAPNRYHDVVEPCTALTLVSEGRGLHWTRPHSVESATFDLVSGDLTSLRQSGGDFTLATDSCLAQARPEHYLSDNRILSPGDGVWYLLRQITAAGVGTFDVAPGSQSEPRDDEIAASAGACS
jgi:hypothetical protein